MLLASRQSLEQPLAGIEWATLFFFLGQFVMVGALEQTGAVGKVAEAIADLTAGNHMAELLDIAWASALGSALVDNIPFTAAMVRSSSSSRAQTATTRTSGRSPSAPASAATRR